MRSMDVTWYHTRSVVLQRCQWRMSWYRNAMTWRCDRSKVWSLPTEWSLTANASSWLYYYTQYKYMHVGTLSHVHILNLRHAHRHTDIQTYRPKVCIWKQHNSHALVSTLSTIKRLLARAYFIRGLRILSLDAKLRGDSIFCTFYSSFHPKNCDISFYISIFPK